MTTFVLVHGASHGSWCWDKVVPLLEAQGHYAIAVDLPGNTFGALDIPANRVNLDTYVTHVCKALDRLDEPVVLVGHSMGGLTITQTAERRPDKIRSLVYLTALLFESGKAMRPVESRQPDDVRKGLEEDMWTVAPDLATISFHDESLRSRFYNDCSDDDFVWAKSMLAPQPSGPMMDPMQTTEENFGRVPKVYIECLQDGAIPHSYQKHMQTKVPCGRAIIMDTGHSPFLSAPQELAGHLMSI